MTKTKKYHWLFKLWVKIRGLLALLIVLAGVVVGLLSLLLPFDSLYKDRLEAFLEEQWNLQVKVNEIEGSWQGYGPYFSLKGLELIGKQSIQLGTANLSINVYRFLIPGGATGIDLSINQAELDMIHAVDGPSITINDDQDEARFTEMLDKILTTGSISVDEMTLNLADESGQVLLAGLKADLLLEQDEDYRALRLLIENDEGNQSIDVISKGLRSLSLTRDAQWYLKFNHFELSQLDDLVTAVSLPAGQLNGEVWLTAETGEVKSVTGHLQWLNSDRDFSMDVLIKQVAQAKDWQATVSVQNMLIKQQQLPDFTLLLQRKDDLSQIQAADIPMALLAEFWSEIQRGEQQDSDWSSTVGGEIDHLALSYDDFNNLWLGGEVGFSGLSAQHPSLQIRGLSGLFEFTPEQGRLLLDSVDGAMRIPNIYRGELNWAELIAQMSVDFTQPIASLKVNNLWCECTDFNLQVWSEINFDEPINLLLNSRLSAVDVSALHKYWPHNVWKEKTLNWLDEGLLGGEVETGFVFVNGAMVHKGFDSGAAQFISRAYTQGVENRFHAEWPVVTGIDAVTVFNHDSAHVDIQAASTLGLNISTATVDIQSFDQGILSIDLVAESKDNQILDYIRTSPLIKNIDLNKQIKVGGRQTTNLAFDVAIKPSVDLPFSPSGQVEFKQGQFFTEHFAIDQINGPVELNGYQLKMKDLAAKLGAAAVKLNGQIVTKSDEGVKIDVDLSGPIKANYLLELIQQDLPIKGESDWRININNTHTISKDQLAMSARSNLAGTSIALPAPLNKTADESKSLAISCDMPCQNSKVEINYNNQIKSTLDSQAGHYQLSKLQFLDAINTANEGALFGGHIDVLDLDQWLQLLKEERLKKTEATPVVTDNAGWPGGVVELNIKQLIFMSRAFQNLDLRIQRMDNSYKIEIDSAAIKGQVLLDDDLDQKGIVAEFEYLDWIEPIAENFEQLVKEAAQTKIPDIHLWANDFSYAGIPLGALRMEMRNVADGVKVEQLSLKSTLAEINVSGFWNKTKGPIGESTFDIVMISEQIADFLHTVGFNAPITNAQTLIEIKAQWQGVPSQFNIANIDGDLEIKIGQGQVLDQDPGFGRVLGLFNLTNLPRRLILDFRDVLADGLLFSSMEGKFKITAGVATTDDFLIKASSAKIHIKGDVDFADQTYAQTITVRPQIGKTFPTIGAIAGGPVGAAAGFLVQGLFDKQIKNSNEIIYQVTGTWDDPVIELIEKDDQ